jgi:hypothetical protein
MGKYALILAFSYNRVLGADYNITYLSSSINDALLITEICKSKGIEPQNTTLLMDIMPGKTIPKELTMCNLRTNPYPSDLFVCREISQFIENTVRGITDSSYKDDYSNVEILFYISCHGKNLLINGKKTQGIVLTTEEGTSLRYLLAKDIFNIIFGHFPVSDNGQCQIPIYSEIKTRKVTETSNYIENVGIEESITIFLSPPIVSPDSSPEMNKPYRSSYYTKRGIPVCSKMLIIVDTCYSEHMTYFPFIYEPKTQTMIKTDYYNDDFGEDLPYCVTISSCESDKTSKFYSEGSSLTNILYRSLNNLKGRLNIAQLHYSIYNSNNKKIIKMLNLNDSHPIITSTSICSENDIPFFSNVEKQKTKNIEK